MRRDIQHLIDEQIERSRTMMQISAEVLETERRPKPGPVITISRQLGGIGEQVAEVLAERLGFSLWDKTLVDAIAKDADVSRRLVEEFDERRVSEIEIFARTIVGEPGAGRFIYAQHLVKVLLSIAEHGYAIILGRGANFALPLALNVRLVSTLETRVSNLMQTEGISRQDAIDRLNSAGRDRAAFVHDIFSRDINDLYAYDLVIRTDCFGVEGTVEMMVAALAAQVVV